MAKIMIAEDERSVVILMRFILEKVGHTVTEAFNGKEALKILGVDPPNPKAALPELIILDVMMPLMDGYTVAITRKDDARLGQVPVILVTAKSDLRNMFDALPNVKTFLSKPFDPQQLRDAVLKSLKAP